VDKMGQDTIDNRLSLTHVGGRGGSRGFPHTPVFEGDCINVLYDADQECIEQVIDTNQENSSELHVFPYCLGDECRKALFHIAYDPYCSSLLEFNDEYRDFYKFYCVFDYIYTETAQQMETREVDLVTLDHLFETGRVNVPPPDFLSIDAEGFDYEVLKGALSTVRSSVLGIIVEVQFFPFYKGQKTFGDVSSLLQENGFYFCRFDSLHHGMMPYRTPIGLRADDFHSGADALFLKRTECIEAGSDGDAYKRYIMLRKLAFISMAFNQFAYGVKCLEKSLPYRQSSRVVDRVYLRFLDEIEEAVRKVPPFYPHTFTSEFTFEQSKGRFNKGAGAWTRSIPKEKVAHLINSFGYEEVEAILVKYGMSQMADLMKENRIYQTISALWANGYLEKVDTDLISLVTKYISEQRERY